MDENILNKVLEEISNLYLEELKIVKNMLIKELY